MRAFLDKHPFKEMLSQVPVKIILNPDAALLGAAIAAGQDIRHLPSAGA